jgi:hypothetical protein
VADAATSLTVLLVGDTHEDGNRGSAENVEQGCRVGDDLVVGIVEDDFACRELLCASILILLVAGVFSSNNAQQKVKRDGQHVATRLQFFIQHGHGADFDEMVDCGNCWDGEFVLRAAILASVRLDLSLDW